MKEELERVRKWAKDKIQDGSEPPWSWYQLMKLVETVDAILDGMDSTITMESSQRSAAQQGIGLRLVDSTSPQDTAQPRRVGLPVQLPM